MGIYSNIYTSFRRLKASMRGDRHFVVFNMLSNEQWLNDRVLEALRIERFRKLAQRALDKSPFYQERLADHRSTIEGMTSLTELENLPLLTRDDLQENYRQILCPVDDTVYADSSGGSTGNPVNFYHDRYYQTYANGLHLLFLSWMKITYGSKTAIFWGADRDFGQASWREKLNSRLERVVVLNSFNVDDAAMDGFLDRLRKFRPEYIYGYASSLELAARRINASNRWTIRPRAVRSSAEMLFESQRTEIEKAFGCKVYNFYGSREINNLAAECPAHEGLHIFASGRIVEVVDESGRQLPPGETGLLAVTDLTNHSFPFIRYITGDMGTLKAGRCSCGRSYPLLSNLAGRVSDIISLGGKQIHGEYFTHLFYSRPEIKQFQVVQEDAELLKIKIVSRTDSIDTSLLERTIRDKVGETVKIVFELVENIAPLKSGKYRFTINNYRNNIGDIR